LWLPQGITVSSFPMIIWRCMKMKEQMGTRVNLGSLTRLRSYCHRRRRRARGGCAQCHRWRS
jgi:hypothetical protein